MQAARRARSRLNRADAHRNAHFLRIEFRLDAAISHRRRVARPGARHHRRRDARRPRSRHRRAQRAAPAPPGRLRPRPPHGRSRATAPRSSRACATAARPARPSRCSSATATGSTGSRRCTSSARCRRAPPAPKRAEVTRPRPGHADLAGALKYGHDDIRDVLERASARETAARVAAGTLARQLLGRFGVRIASHVSAIGDVALAGRIASSRSTKRRRSPTTRRSLRRRRPCSSR